MKDSSVNISAALSGFWPYIVAAVMIAYLILLLVMIADDVSRTDALVTAFHVRPG